MDNWQKNQIQYPRLIAELEACGAFENRQIINDLCDSMDLTKEDILEIVERASNYWDEMGGGVMREYEG